MYKNLGKFGRNPGWIPTAIVCMIYGIGFAVAPDFMTKPVVFWPWTALCGVLFIAFLVIPFIIWMTRSGSRSAA